jgi:hypothetical protein
MLLMDPTKVDSLILSETLRRTSLRPSHFRQLLNTKSSLLTKQIIQPMMYNSFYGRLLRSLLTTADLSSPATTKTKLLNHSIPGVLSLIFGIKGKEKAQLQSSFFKRLQIILGAEGIEYDQKVLAELHQQTLSRLA